MPFEMDTGATINWSKNEMRVIDICHQIHKHAEDFYSYLASIHQEHREIGRMWGLLSIDKCKQSQTFKFVEKLKGLGVSEIRLTETAATNILNKIKSLPISDDNKIHSQPIDSTLRFVAKMEESLSEVHFDNVVKYKDNQYAILMISSLKPCKKIQTMLNEHII
jgi:hypothetical protein